jgi:HEAT repeat protein
MRNVRRPAPMTAQKWKELDALLRRVRDGDESAPVLAFLHENASTEDVPGLIGLLNDEDIVVREIVAEPLGRLASPAVLPQLLTVLQRGLDEGHDCDSLQAVLAEIVEADKAGARQVLKPLTTSSDKATRENAEWLLEFCEETPDA